MTKTEARADVGQGYYQIDKKEMAQAVATCLFAPVIVRKGKEALFEDPYYKSIFGSKDIAFYLPKSWLMRGVQNAARGYPERAYAKWLVLNFVWSQIGKEIGAGLLETKFRRACERKVHEVQSPLANAFKRTFQAALKFYRQNRSRSHGQRPVHFFPAIYLGCTVFRVLGIKQEPVSQPN